MQTSVGLIIGMVSSASEAPIAPMLQHCIRAKDTCRNFRPARRPTFQWHIHLSARIFSLTSARFDCMCSLDRTAIDTQESTCWSAAQQCNQSMFSDNGKLSAKKKMRYGNVAEDAYRSIFSSKKVCKGRPGRWRTWLSDEKWKKEKSKQVVT